jgi:hypothetical protein
LVIIYVSVVSVLVMDSPEGNSFAVTPNIMLKC